MNHAVETFNLTRIFKSKPSREEKKEKKGIQTVTALENVNMTIKEGELFGLLGPNGAGKTTLIKILCTLLLPTSGSAKVGGFDVVNEVYQVRRIINMVSGGESSGYGILTVRENLWMFSQLYGVPTKLAKRRIDEMLDVVGLQDKANMKVHKLSTGMRQKMNVCRGFITDSKILFLDEPTLGLDVNAARTIRTYVKNWVKEQSGKTILLTTHYMTEADELCDRVAVIDNGKVLACDSPEALKKSVKKESVFQLETTLLGKGTENLRTIKGVNNFALSQNLGTGRTTLKFIISDESAVSDIISFIANKGAKIISLKKTEPTLEDVFVKLVGRGLESPAT